MADLAALESHLGYWLRVVSNAVSLEFRRQIEARGVTVAEWVVLRKLLDLGAVAPIAIAEALGVTRGAVSRLNDRLLAKELIAITPHPVDRRQQVVELTPSGRQLVPELAALADANDARFFGVLPASEREQLRRLLETLVVAHRLGGAALD